ncbi:MAG: DUF4062 domain-containing protein [Planctomycetaceae bacterium]
MNLLGATSDLRVFLSSTFVDMIAERDALQRTTFPSLYRTAPVDVIPIDLRWGIRDENTIGGKLIDLCLDSVSRSSVFVGMIGQRYGAVIADEILATKLPQRDYLKLGLSLTECEIRAAFAMKESGEGPQHLFFGFRKNDWTFLDERVRLLLPDAFRNYAPYEFADDDPALLGKLADLRDFIRSRDCTVIEYANADEFAECVRRELIQIAPRLRQYSGPHYRGNVANSAAQSLIDDWRRGKRLFLIPTPRRLLLVGESGIGKTHEVTRYLSENSENILCVVADQFSSMEGCLQWLEDRLQVSGHECANAARPIRRRVFERLVSFGNSDQNSLILDGLEELSVIPDLSWLPDCRLRVLATTTTDSKWHAAFERLDFTVADFPALSNREALKLSTDLLARYDKQEWLSITQAVRVRGLRNPQMLATLIGGLHREVYETVDETVDDYADFSSASRMIARTWGKLVEDLERSPEDGVVRRILHFVSISPAGIHSYDLERLLRTTVKANTSIAMSNLRPFLKEDSMFIRLRSAAFNAARRHLNPTREELRQRWNEYGEFFSRRDDIPLSRRWAALRGLGERSSNDSWCLSLLASAPREIMELAFSNVRLFLHTTTRDAQLKILDVLYGKVPAESLELAAQLGHTALAAERLERLPPHQFRLAVIRVAPALIDSNTTETARRHLMHLLPLEMPVAERIQTLLLLAHLEVNEGNLKVAERILDSCEGHTLNEDPLSLSRCWITLFRSRIEFAVGAQIPIQRMINLQQTFLQHEEQRGAGWAAVWMFDVYEKQGNYTEANMSAMTLIGELEQSKLLGLYRIISLRLAHMLVSLDRDLSLALRLLDNYERIGTGLSDNRKQSADTESLRAEILRRFGGV